MAELCSSSVRDLEKTSVAEEQPLYPNNEADTIEMIRMSAKAYSRGGDEKSGCHQQWKTYTKVENKEVLFLNFMGNRFKIMFYTAQALLYHCDLAKTFLNDVHEVTNQLLESHSKALQYPLYVSHGQVLRLVLKLRTSPFWLIVENCNHILYLNDQYLQICAFQYGLRKTLYLMC